MGPGVGWLSHPEEILSCLPSLRMHYYPTNDSLKEIVPKLVFYRLAGPKPLFKKVKNLELREMDEI